MDLTKAAIEDIVVRGDINSWRGLMQAIRRDASGRLVRRARDLLSGADRSDSRVRAFAKLLSATQKSRRADTNHE
jgi:hypothetical protein